MDLGHGQAIYSAIDAGISTKQPAKFCDLVGFEGRYIDPKSGIRYYSKDQYQAIIEMPQTVKDEILSVRKANIILRWLKKRHSLWNDSGKELNESLMFVCINELDL